MINRYSDKTIENVWSLQHQYGLWREIEKEHLKTILPDIKWDNIFSSISISLQKIESLEKKSKHDMTAFLDSLLSQSKSEDLHRWIHFGLTSSDIKDTAFVLQLRKSLVYFKKLINKMRITLRFAQFNDKTLFSVARTHGQYAETMLFARKFQLFGNELVRVCKKIDDLLENQLIFGKLSGAIGDNKYLSKVHEEKTLKSLGLQAISADNCTQIIPRDIFCDVYYVISLFGSVCERFLIELRHLCSSDIAELQENFTSDQKGSSAMPHKKNPIGMETISGICRLVKGSVVQGLDNISLWHERDMTHSSVERVVLPDSFHLVCYICKKLNVILENLQINRENIENRVKKYQKLLNSQDKMISLIRKGYSRSDAYALSKKEST